MSASRRTLALAEEILRLRAILADLQGQLSEHAFTSQQLQLQLSDAEQQVSPCLSTHAYLQVQEGSSWAREKCGVTEG